MLANLLLSAGSAFAALALWTHAGITRPVAFALGLLSLWQLRCAIGRRTGAHVILRLGGFSWDIFSFCRGWLITGQVGTGKTVAAINTMLWQVSKNCPTWGGVCVDDKGLYWETLSPMLGHLGRASDLILLQVRPENAGNDWKPTHRFNFLDNPHLPWSAKAKIVCDVAAALGQRSEQSFFRMQAQVQMEFAFKALHCAELPVTLETTYDFLSSDSLLREIMAMVATKDTREARLVVDHYRIRAPAHHPSRSMKTILLLLLALAMAGHVRAQIPVTDVANLANNQVAQAANIAKWVESIAHLKTQIDQLNQQISIQGDIRQWTGNPVEAGGKLTLNVLGAKDLVREYGQAKNAILGMVDSLDSLKHTSSGSYRAIASVDLDGNEVQRDPLTFRRYAVLDATQANTDQVTADTKTRETELQEEIALTLEDLKAAPTEAETQKISAKLAALNGQLAQVETTRRREVDAVALQKMANDSRLEEERLAAAESAAKDDYLANQRVSAYMKTIRVRQNPPDEK